MYIADKKMKADAVFIDLDDTVWDFTKNSDIALRHTYDVYKIEKWAGEYEQFRAPYAIKNNEMWELYHYGKIDKDSLGIERFKYPLTTVGYDLPDIIEVSGEMNRYYLEYLATLPNLVDGAEHLLKYLSSKYKLGILSNGFKGIQQKKLKSAGVFEYIHTFVLSDDVGVTKPLKGIFDAALCRVNTLPENTVMIGDNYDADICGAANAGWRTIYFNRKGFNVDNCVADAIVTELSQIEGIL